MTQTDTARAFAALHVPGTPLVLYNIWDAGSARAVAEGGARAIATGSWSVAAAQGYGDGQELPLEALLATAARIVAAVNLPVTVDFEGGYAETPEGVAANVARLAATGAVGFNFEDQVVGGAGLYPVERQADRIAAARRATDVPMVLNARTDLFLKAGPKGDHAALLPEALDRAAAYAEAGASAFFVPGLTDPDLIARVCEGTGLPVNVMTRDGGPKAATLAALGVARISYGPSPYRTAMQALTQRAAAV